ncbi:hypothetical protein MVEN_01745400 [Mycena venus]|uniref:Uncharacterized protein n=1 Tax=Mycena venus TaxID=2733690 RepID=A0A8H6XMI7_9AGAR|nr:hypothetical protein MVEN_01745400 [Mycena venus]
MSASYQKDRVLCVGVYKAPPNLSKEALQVKAEALVDSLLAVPIAQKNYVKFEINFQNALLDEHLKALGYPEAQPGVWVTGECETEAKFEEILKDPEIAKLIQEAEHLEHFSVFFADVVAKVDIPTTKNRVRVMSALKPPVHLSSNDFHHQAEAILDRFLALPVAEGKTTRLSLWRQTTNMATTLQETGFPAPDPVLVLVYEAETQEALVEMMTDSSLKMLVSDAIRDISVHLDSSTFAADVITKIDKS